MTGAEEIVVRTEGEVIGRHFSVAEVEVQLTAHPWMACYMGLGNVADEHGFNLWPGRHVMADREKLAKIR